MRNISLDEEVALYLSFYAEAREPVEIELKEGVAWYIAAKDQIMARFYETKRNNDLRLG